MNLVKTLKYIFRPAYIWLKVIEMRFKYAIFKSKIINPKDIPIIINNRNRHTSLENLIKSLEHRGYYNIHIIDNKSTYPPLLKYYKHIPYPIYFLKKNTGYLAIWKSGIYKKFYKDFYVYTDSDVVLIEECPDDFMKLFRDTLVQYKNVQKVGFSLKIDDLPDTFKNKQAVIEFEKRYYKTKITNLLYEAAIDTTFALYRPGAKGGASSIKMFRTDYPYQARHIPWYVNSQDIGHEEMYYIEHAHTSSHWTILQ